MKWWRGVDIIYLFCILISPLYLQGSSIGESIFASAEEGLKESRYPYSKDLFQKAAAIFRATGKDSAFAAVQNKIAGIELNLAKDENAIFLLRQNEDFIHNKFGTENELMCVCSDLLGDYYMMLSDAEVARECYLTSYSTRIRIHGVDDCRTAISLAKIAGYHNFKINKDSAYYFSKKAYAIYKSHEFDWKNYRPFNILIQYAYATKIFYGTSVSNFTVSRLQARVIYGEALEVCEKLDGKASLEYARILKDIGNTYTDETFSKTYETGGNKMYFEKALQYYDSSLNILKSKLPPAHPQLATLYFVKAILYGYRRDKDCYKKAMPFYRQAVQALFTHKVDVENLSEEDLARCPFKYDLMNILFNARGNYKACYDTYHDFNYLKQSYADSKMQLQLWKEIIREFKSPYANRLIAVYNGNLFDVIISDAWELYNISSDRQYLNDIYLYSELSKKSLRDKLLVEANSSDKINTKSKEVTVEDVQKQLKNRNTLFIEYFKENTIIGITKDTCMYLQLTNTLKTDSLVNCLTLELKQNDSKNYSVTSNLIYQTFILPVLSKCATDIKELIVVPDGELCKLSFSAINTNEKKVADDFRKIDYLIKDVTVRYVLSATDFLDEEDQQDKFNGKVIAFSPFFIDKPALPFSKRILDELKKKVAGDFYFEADANANTIKSKASGYSVIHFSTHAEMEDNEINSGKLFINADHGRDVYLTLDSIYKYNLKSKLTVLSACNTNTGKYEFGEGTMSFSRAFLTVGSQSTLTTLWSVDDKSTNAILSNFYNDLVEKKPKSVALQNSQLNYLSKSNTSNEANPIFWSGIILTGSDGIVALQAADNAHSLFIFRFLIVLVLLFFVFKRRGHRS